MEQMLYPQFYVAQLEAARSWLAANALLLSVSTIGQMIVVAEVYETDIRRIKVGQKAVITSKAFASNQQLTGTVEQINKLVYKNDVLKIDPTAAADARVFEVRIKLDNSDTASKLNYLQVDVQIKVSQ